MEVVSDLQNEHLACRRGAVTVGNFDGVHLGHQDIIEQLTHRARAVDGPSVVLTFVPHPIQLLRPDRLPPPLTTLDRKLELLEMSGVDVCVTYPTTLELLELSADTFFRQIIQVQLAARAMVEGPNFYFGKNRGGDTKLLEKLCRAAEIQFSIVEPSTAEGQLISSSRIRAAVSNGRVAEARQLLGYGYRVSGTVIEGARRGNTIGFPTANLAGVETLLPKPGVYAGRAFINSDRSYVAAINVGPNPTFGEHDQKFEVHLVDFSGDLYGELLQVEFVDWLREVRPFASVEQLVAQLKQDVEAARAAMR